MPRVTIQVIARLAHVSVSTVSLVLRKQGYVSESTRRKVERFFKEQNHHPRRPARHLVN